LANPFHAYFVVISLAEQTITCFRALGRPGHVACVFDLLSKASAAGPILLAWLCG
jgi:hypothetical protein